MALSKLPISGNGAAVSEAVKRAAASWKPDTRVCVALSGGVDSVALLHAAAALRDSLDLPWLLVAHHVHHGLSSNADAWAAHCETICSSLNVSLAIDHVHVDRRSKMGIEAAARNARYGALDKVDAQIVLLAHHARDQAETVLLQLLRGSGSPGLAAMPGAAGRYVRPMLAVSNASILAYAASHALTCVDDESNDDVRFARNRLRAQVWPELTRAFPSAEATLARAAAHQADAATLLVDLATIDAKDCVVNGALQLDAFNALSRPRRANLLRHWLAESAVDVPGTETLREWLQQLASPEPTQAICLRSADGQTTIRVYRGAAYVVHHVPRWHSCAWNAEPEMILQGDHEVAGCVTAIPSDATNALRWPPDDAKWTLRMREDGDVIELSARSGRVNVKNIFQNAGIPPWQRERWPILTCDKTVVSVVGIATANAFAARVGERGIEIEWKPCEWKPSLDRASRS